MTKFLSFLSLLCVCWALPSPSGTWIASTETAGRKEAAHFTTLAPGHPPKPGMTSFAGDSPLIFSHLSTAEVDPIAFLSFLDAAAGDTADSIAVSRESVTFSKIGAAITLTATVFDAEGTILDDVPLVWIAANPAVATVDQNGVVTAVGNGTTRIAITAGTVSVKIPVLVESNGIIPESERKVLVTFYETTDGENWDQNTNWQSEHPLHEWYGVRTDEKGAVTELRLMDNDLAGPIPPELGGLSALVRLELSGNQLSGSIPAALGTPEDLEVLNLSGNDLTGELPERIGDLSNLITLDVSANAQLTGELPVTLPRLDALDEFRYDGTGLCVPEVTAVENWLTGLSVHRGTGQPCAPPTDREVLEDLYAALGGAQWANADNWNTNAPFEDWQGITLDGQGRVSRLDLRGQGLDGTLPSSIATLTYLTHLTLDDNNLEGPIPPELGTLEDLVHLRAHSAALTGGLPGELGNLENLEQLDLSDNDLAGAIPAAWGDLGNLNELSLNANGLSGPLPSELGRLSELHTLSIADNQGLSGEVPASFVNLEALRVFDADRTGVCLPANPLLQRWNDGLTTSSLSLCAPPAEPALELSVSNLSVTEGGSSTYTAQLSSEPAGTVTIAMTGHAGTALRLDKPSLTFDPATWNTAQTVTVTAGPDVNATSETISLIHTASGADYANVQATLIVTVADRDAATLNLSASALPVDEGSSTTYTLRLASEPAGTVTVAITGHAGTSLKLDKTALTFTRETWNIAQTVTVTASPDANAISEIISLLHTASGANYEAVQATVMVTVADRDAATLNLSTSALSVTEESSNTYTLRLASEPAGTVTVAITGHAGTALKLDKASLTFTQVTWNVAQTVTVTADPDANAVNETITLVHVASGANYGTVRAELVVTVTDDDPAGVLIVSPGSISIPEGSQNTYTVRLSSEPAGTVTAATTGHEDTELKPDKTSLIFTAATWNAAQTVTVSAEHDLDADEDHATLLHTASGADYAGVTANVEVTVKDDDAPGTLVFSSATLSVTEGSRNTYTVQLSRAPTAAVTTDIAGFADTDLTPDKTSLTFTPTTWNQSQTVTVTAGPDDDGTNDTATLIHTTSGANYDGISGNVAVTIEDDDTPELDLSTSSLEINEGGSSQYTVRLSTQPATNITVTITRHADADLTLDKESLTFTAATWNQGQTVTVSADNDMDSDNDTAALLHTASGDEYENVTANVAVTVMDDDTADLDLSASNLEINEESNQSYTVRLSSMPAADVTVVITGYANTDLTLNKTNLTFTQATWNQNQTITVTAGPDEDGMDDTATLAHSASGDNYGGVTGNVAVTVKDDDTPGTLLFSSETISVPEGGNNTYTVRLSSAPTAAVTVEITGHANTDLELDKTSLTFSAMTWNQPLTITVTADTDNDARNESATLLHTVSGANYDGVSGNVSVTINDADTATPGLHLSVSSLEMNEGGTQSYTVQLSTQPTANVTVSISNSNSSTDLTLNATRLNFTDQNWDTAQTVTLTSKEDLDWTTDYERLTHTASGGDYGGMSTEFLVSVVDSDSPPAPPHAYVFQAILSFFNTVPLIAGEAAFLRVFPTVNTPGNTPLPKAVATFYLNDMVEHTVTIAGKPGPIPTEVRPEELRLSLSADIPASVIQPGLEMVIEIDPDDKIPDHLGVTKRIPSAGRMSIDVVAVPTLNLTLIPFVTTGLTERKSIVTTVEDMALNPGEHANLSDVRTLLPIKDISATAHAAVTVDTRDSFILYQYTVSLRAMEGGSGYWIGLHSSPLGGSIGTISGTTSFAVARPWDIVHELGHNLSLVHAPCGYGIQGVDPHYPYKNASIGSWGYLNGRMKDPQIYEDLMSYCLPEWISDYNFNKLLGYYLSKSSTIEEPPLTSASMPSEISLLLWGRTDAAARPFLEPIFEVDAAPALPRESGPWQLAGHSASGDELFRLPFSMPVIADGDGSSSFAFVIPLQQTQAPLLDSVTLSGPGGSYTIDKEHNTPMAIVMDQDSGQVTGFLNNYDPLDDHRIAAISNKVGGGTQRVLFSRGIPNLGVQN